MNNQHLTNLLQPPAAWNWYEKILFRFFFVFFILFILLNNNGAFSADKEYGKNAAPSTYLGFYEVRKFVVNNKEMPPIATDLTRWKHLNIRSYQPAVIRLMTDSLKSYEYNFVFGKENYIELTPVGEPAYTKKTLKIESDGNGITSLSGKLNADSVQVFLHKKKPDEFLLMNRGFNWINERPFNR